MAPDSIVHSSSPASADSQNLEIDGSTTARTSSPVNQVGSAYANNVFALDVTSGGDGTVLPRQPEDSSYAINAGIGPQDRNFRPLISFLPSSLIHSNPPTELFGGAMFLTLLYPSFPGEHSLPPPPLHHYRSTAPRRGVLNPENTGDPLAPSGVALDYGNAIRSGSQPPHALFAPIPLPSGNGVHRFAAHVNYVDAPTPPLPASATLFPSIGSAGVAAGLVRSRRPRLGTPLDQVRRMVRSLLDDEFDVLLQEMGLLSRERAATRNGLHTGVARPSFSQASTFSQVGGVGGRDSAEMFSEYYPSASSLHFNYATAASGVASTPSASTSAAAASPQCPHCGGEHDAYQHSYLFFHDTNASPMPQGVFGPYSQPPQQGQLEGHGQDPIFEGSPSSPIVHTNLPETNAGEWLYCISAHGNDDAMEQCCAIDYSLDTLDSTALLSFPRGFPSRLQIPRASHRHFTSLARRFGPIFAHAYFHDRLLALTEIQARPPGLPCHPPVSSVSPSSSGSEDGGRRSSTVPAPGADVPPPTLLDAALHVVNRGRRGASSFGASGRRFGRSRTDTMMLEGEGRFPLVPATVAAGADGADGPTGMDVALAAAAAARMLNPPSQVQAQEKENAVAAEPSGQEQEGGPHPASGASKPESESDAPHEHLPEEPPSISAEPEPPSPTSDEEAASASEMGSVVSPSSSTAPQAESHPVMSMLERDHADPETVGAGAGVPSIAVVSATPHAEERERKQLGKEGAKQEAAEGRVQGKGGVKEGGARDGERPPLRRKRPPRKRRST
ncbi:hypothetical protein C8R45DRAFT_1095594 [Mycena sanguinolenta]|nr:hypothetical protein C8R45DRAFT_1095594 [Mycena sanguinolenta]